MSSTSSSPDTYARLRPSWPGASSAWATARGERMWNRGPPPFVDGTVLPSQKSTVKGRSGSALSSSERNGAVVEPSPMVTR